MTPLHLERRELLVGAAALAAASLVPSALAAEEHHHHAMLASPLLSSISICLEKGQVCLSHCLVLLGEGEKAMAGCARSVKDMLAVCGALQSLAAAQSPALASQARVALEVCKACATECKKHADKHAECKACLEACEACAAECKKLAA